MGRHNYIGAILQKVRISKILIQTRFYG